MNSINISFIFLLISAAFASQKPVYINDIWYNGSKDATLPLAVAKGVIRYSIRNDLEDLSIAEMRFDFEVALQAWVKAIGRPQTQMIAVETIAESDLLLHYGTKTLSTNEWDGMGAHFVTSMYRVLPGKILPVVEFGRRYTMPWITLIKSVKEGGIVVKEQIPEGARIHRPLSDYTGHIWSPQAVAASLMATKPIIRSGRQINVEGRVRYLLAATLMHELGHAFGLADLYADDADNTNEAIGYDSIMGNALFKPVFPSDVDAQRVKEHMQSYACHLALNDI